MTDSPQNDEQLRATEAQMRQALGLRGDTPPRPQPDLSMPGVNGSTLHRRRFVKDGEVPATVIHREHRADGEPGTNQLEIARQAIRSQAAARERAERSLEEAQAKIRDLQTKWMHERLAKDEALQAVLRAEAERQTVQQTLQAAQAELIAERLAHQKTGQQREQAVAARLEAERLARELAAAAEAHRTPPEPSVKRKASASPEVFDATVTLNPPRRRGRPPKVRAQVEVGQQGSVGEQDSDVVEWWNPGWREKIR